MSSPKATQHHHREAAVSWYPLPISSHPGLVQLCRLFIRFGVVLKFDKTPQKILNPTDHGCTRLMNTCPSQICINLSGGNSTYASIAADGLAGWLVAVIFASIVGPSTLLSETVFVRQNSQTHCRLVMSFGPRNATSQSYHVQIIGPPRSRGPSTGLLRSRGTPVALQTLAHSRIRTQGFFHMVRNQFGVL